MHDWRTYDESRAAAFEHERAAPDEHVEETRRAVTAELSAAGPRPVLDVGAGTGLWSDRLARWLARPVLALEPSAAMLHVLCRKRLRDVVAIQGRAEQLPLRDAACDIAWLSTVVHHFEDLAAAAEEVARVLAARGVALVRGSFAQPGSQTIDALPARFFPSSRRVTERFPTVAEVCEAFERPGLALRRRVALAEIAARTRREYLERLHRRADSLVRAVPDDEFERGLHAARRWVDEAPQEPVRFTPDLLVFGRPTGPPRGDERSSRLRSAV